MIEQRIAAVKENLDELNDLYSRHEQSLADEVAAKTETIIDVERENRELQGKCNMLEIGAKEHERENARSIFAGFIVGAVLGTVFAVLFFG